jgi:hypothetical protein
MLGIRASFREDSEFSPAEAVFGSQLFLPGQFVNTAESPSPSFLNDLQTTMTGHPTLPTWHKSGPAPPKLPEELLLARCVQVRRDGAGPPRRRAAAAVPDLRRSLLSAGAVDTFLSPRDGRENRQGVHTQAQGSQDTSRDRASKAATQGSPRCTGATCPCAAAKTAGAAATGDLQPSTDNANNNFIIIISIRPPASQRPAAEPTQPLSLPPQSLGGICGAVPSVPTMFPALTIM